MIKRLLYLNGYATVAAVVHHSINWVLIGMFWWTDRYRAVSIPNFEQLGSVNYYGIRVVDQLTVVAVPAFLFISGVHIAIATGLGQNTVDWRLIINRIGKLLPPYLIWSVLIILFNLLQGESYSILALTRILLLGQAAAPFYYVPLLIQLLILSPWLIPLARKRAALLLMVTAALTILMSVSYYSLFLGDDPPGLNMFFTILRDWHLPGYIFWFALGIVIKFHLSGIKRSLSKISLWLVIGLMLTFILGIIEWDLFRVQSGREWISAQVTLIDKVFTLLFILSYINFDRLDYPFATQLAQIGTKSYGIYLSHTLFLELVARTVYHILPGLLAFPYLFDLGLVVAGLGIPLTMMAVFEKSPLRRMYRYFYG